jgi:hypothetical protein
MAEPASKLSLHDLTAMARDIVARYDHAVVGTIPAEGDSEYAEVVVMLKADQRSPMKADPGSSDRLTIGVHRTESPESIREHIECRMERVSKEAR